MVSSLPVRNRLQVRIRPDSRAGAKVGMWVGLAGSRIANKVLGVRALLCPTHHPASKTGSAQTYQREMDSQW